MLSIAPRRYARPVGLVACPFCREMFEKNEAKTCPVCGLSLSAMEKLPLSHDAASEELVHTLPEQEVQPWLYWKRNRGPLALVPLLGIALFFLPWIHMKIPTEMMLSGFTLGRIGVLAWAAFAGWMVLFPTVLSRRSIIRMRGARVAAALLSAIPGVTVAILALNRQKSALYTVSYEHTWAFWATLALSIVGVALSIGFGGPLDDIEVRKGSKAARREGDETLH